MGHLRPGSRAVEEAGDAPGSPPFAGAWGEDTVPRGRGEVTAGPATLLAPW